MSYPATDNHHGQLESLTPAARHWLDGGQAWWALPEVARSKWPRPRPSRRGFRDVTGFKA
jgi:hypothetical protein